MPANVTVDFAKARDKCTQARTLLEKLAALEEMRRFAPKHKGGEKLRAEISGKIAKVRKEIEKEKQSSSKKGSALTMSVRKEGCAQIVIIGVPNSGKSTLLKKLTNADVEIAPYEFTTIKPELGMMDYFGAKVQLVELPALIEGSSSGKAQGTQILSVVRTSDAIAICAQTKEDAKTVEKELRNAGILVNEDKPRIVIKPSAFKGITITGKDHLKMPESQLISFLINAGIRNANIIISEDATIEKFAKVLDSRLVYKKAVVINPFLDEERDLLKEKLFSILGKVLVYTKRPGEDADLSQPLVLDKGATVSDLAKMLHKEIAKKFRYARIWGSAKFPGQRVSRNHALGSRDIVEIMI